MDKKRNHWNINNSYSKLPKKLYSKQLPEKSLNPEKIYFNSNLASELGLNKFSENEILDYFSGNKIPNGSIPISQAYAGHQFGHFTMLGDGRAVLLGEHLDIRKIDMIFNLKVLEGLPFPEEVTVVQL